MHKASTVNEKAFSLQNWEPDKSKYSKTDTPLKPEDNENTLLCYYATRFEVLS